MFDKLFLLALLPSTITSFAFQTPRKTVTKMEMLKSESISRRMFVSAFGLIFVDTAFAQGYEESSSIQVSEAIKTMDFSLPSSYDSISSNKAKIDTLVITPDEDTKSSVAVSSKKSSIGLPSLYDGGKKEKKKVVVKEEKAEEVKNQKIVIVDMDLPSYSDSTKGKEKSVFAF